MFTPSTSTRPVLFGLLATALAPTAFAHDSAGPPTRPPSQISVQNRFEGEADVLVDGRYAGRVTGKGSLALQVRPGEHDVSVVRPETGYVLASAELEVCIGEVVTLPVAPPTVPMHVTNTGAVGLSVRAEGAEAVWIEPGRTAILTVEAGNVALRASVDDPRGDWVAIERTVWAEPGRPSGASLRADPAVIVVTNRDRFPVHALLDGADLGWISPGATERVYVRPGSAELVFLDRSGRVRTSTAIVAERRNEATVVVTAPPVPVRPTVVVVSGRPSRPMPRPTFTTTVTYAPCHERPTDPVRDEDDRPFHAY